MDVTCSAPPTCVRLTFSVSMPRLPSSGQINIISNSHVINEICFKTRWNVLLQTEISIKWQTKKLKKYKKSPLDKRNSNNPVQDFVGFRQMLATTLFFNTEQSERNSNFPEIVSALIVLNKFFQFPRKFVFEAISFSGKSIFPPSVARVCRGKSIFDFDLAVLSNLRCCMVLQTLMDSLDMPFYKKPVKCTLNFLWGPAILVLLRN